MENDFAAAAAALKSIFEPHRTALLVKSETPDGIYLVTRQPSPMKQHKGEPMFFGSVRTGKAYVSFHLMPLYMHEALTATVSPALRKRMQGKTCFNFKSTPEPAILEELARLTDAGLRAFREKGWA